MSSRNLGATLSLSVFMLVAAMPAIAQSFRVQCPTGTITHPNPNQDPTINNIEPAYTAGTYGSGATFTTGATGPVNGAIKCQQISGGDGYATMGDGTQTYMFSFGPLSGRADMAAGKPGTQFPGVFNLVAPTTLVPGDSATTDGPDYSSFPPKPSLGTFGWNGAAGLAPDIDNNNLVDGHVDARQIMDVGVMNGNIPAPLMAIDEDDEFFLTLTNVAMFLRPDLFEQHTGPLPWLSQRVVIL